MLGLFIDCDADADDHHSNDNHGYQNNVEVECNRWVMWAGVRTFHLTLDV